MIISTNEVIFNEIQSETLVVGISKHAENTTKWNEFSAYFGENILEWVKNGDISSKLKKLVNIPMIDKGAVKRILFVGLGDRKGLTQEIIREVFGLVGKELLVREPESLAIWVPSFTTDTIADTDVAYLAAEGLGMGSFVYDGYKTTSNTPDYYLPTVELLTDDDAEEIISYFELGIILCRCCE